MTQGRVWCRATLAVLWLTAPSNAAEPTAPAVPRVEARSPDLLAVGLVQGDRMTLHLSRLIDNAPVRDAAVTVHLRGSSYPATAEIDGSYSVRTQALTVPGSALVDIEVVGSAAREELKGTLQIATDTKPEDGNSARQLWWWVLNFAVCIGFLMLWSRRRKAAEDKETV